MLTLGFALLSYSSYGQPPAVDLIENFIKHTYPNQTVSLAKGQISTNQKADEYFLAITWREPESAPLEEYGRLAVVSKSPEGRFAVTAQSTTYQMYRTTQNKLEIKKGILNYTYGYSSGCCYGATYTYKFRKNAAGTLELIGKEELIEETIQDISTAEVAQKKSGSSTNYNTQKIIVWSTENGKRKEELTTDKKIKPISFENFSIDGG